MQKCNLGGSLDALYSCYDFWCILKGFLDVLGEKTFVG